MTLIRNHQMPSSESTPLISLSCDSVPKTRAGICKFDAITIGIGPAGMSIAGMGAKMGLNVLAIEKTNRTGGECMSFGCIPSKAILKKASIWRTVKKYLPEDMTIGDEGRYEDLVGPLQADLSEIAEKKMNKMVSGETLHKLFKHEARFKDSKTVAVRPVGTKPGCSEERLVTAKNIFICTGSSPFIPPCAGLREIKHGRLLTNNNIFTIEVPKTITVVGGGFIACELSEAYACLGSKVTIVQRSSRLVRTLPEEVSEMVEEALTKFGCEVIHCDPMDKFTQDPETHN
ncbi:hypothetical protein ADUPG1_007290, partial [Aduncisulcus paluster]